MTSWVAALEVRASAFAREVTTVIGPAAARYESRLHLPELARFDAIGRRTESVVFDPAYDEAANAVWNSGLVALSSVPGSAYEQATLLYLLSLEGEAGQACPATCTIGLARALRRAGDPSVRERFLPALVDPDHAGAQRGSQFLTEVQGGSDIVMSRGQVVVRNGQFTGRKGHGKFLRRAVSDYSRIA